MNDQPHRASAEAIQGERQQCLYILGTDHYTFPDHEAARLTRRHVSNPAFLRIVLQVVAHRASGFLMVEFLYHVLVHGQYTQVHLLAHDHIQPSSILPQNLSYFTNTRVKSLITNNKQSQ
ncbi:hypothetical protein D3C81_1147990 [compost metagenome]